MSGFVIYDVHLRILTSDPPLMSDDYTSSFYDKNAVAYANRDRPLPKLRLDDFLRRLPSGASILELGCGAGQDSAYMLSQGFDVTPTDGSAELAKQAEALIGSRVEVMRFEQLDANEAFHGVWAQASLLHVPRSELGDVFARIGRALKSGGVLHASFKAGHEEGYDGLGRYYNYPSAEWLGGLLGEGGWRGVSISEASGSGFDDKPTLWLYLEAQK